MKGWKIGLNEYFCAPKFKKSEMNKLQFVNSQVIAPTYFPNFAPGDNIIVNYKIVEGDKTRVQAFKGDVINIKGHGNCRTFTVRKMSHGIGVERVFQYANPNIDEITLVKKGRVRRAKLFYLRDLVGKKARIKEKAYNAKDYIIPVKPVAQVAETVASQVESAVDQMDQVVEQAAEIVEN